MMMFKVGVFGVIHNTGAFEFIHNGRVFEVGVFGVRHNRVAFKEGLIGDYIVSL